MLRVSLGCITNICCYYLLSACLLFVVFQNTFGPGLISNKKMDYLYYYQNWHDNLWIWRVISRWYEKLDYVLLLCFSVTDKLRATFEQLNFHVCTSENLTDTEMVQLVQRMSFEDHSNYDCFVCCILTHGIHGALYGVNGITVPIRDMTGPLRAQGCPTLAGKPKLFFMQACQGRDKQEGQWTFGIILQGECSHGFVTWEPGSSLLCGCLHHSQDSLSVMGWGWGGWWSVPGEIKRREVELDPQVSPEEIISREVELGYESWTSFTSGCSSTAVQWTLSLWLCPAQQLKQQLRSALVAVQWREDTALTLP